MLDTLILPGRVILRAAVLGLLVTAQAQAQAQDAPRIPVEGYGVAGALPDVVTIGYDVRGEGEDERRRGSRIGCQDG